MLLVEDRLGRPRTRGADVPLWTAPPPKCANRCLATAHSSHSSCIGSRVFACKPAGAASCSRQGCAGAGAGAAAGCERQASGALAEAAPRLPCHCRKCYLTVSIVIRSNSCSTRLQAARLGPPWRAPKRAAPTGDRHDPGSRAGQSVRHIPLQCEPLDLLRVPTGSCGDPPCYESERLSGDRRRTLPAQRRLPIAACKRAAPGPATTPPVAGY